MTQSKCKFGVCDGSGLLPFYRSDGSISPHCKVFCDCHPQYGIDAPNGCYSRLDPSDIDYPCSSLFRGYSFEICGMPDPGYIPPERQEEAPKPQEIIHRHSNMGKAEFDLLQQTARGLKNLREQVDELSARRKPKTVRI